MGTSPSFDLDSGPPQLAVPPMLVRVYLYDDESEDEPFFRLPNVFCHQVAEREGSEPTSAQFGYILDNTLNRDEGWPCEFEDLFPMQAPGNKYRVRQSDRIVVIASMGEDDHRLLFDGFVTAPQVDVQSNQQEITFAAAGVEARCWDKPIDGRWQTDATRTIVENNAIHTDMPTRFNPDGEGNCSTYARENTSIKNAPHPMFIDKGSYSVPWTLSMAVRYLLARYNGEEEYVDNPDFDVLDDLLNSRRPKEGKEFYNPDDPSTYDEDPITLSDYDCGNRAWPEVLDELLGYYGFGYQFVSELAGDGFPWHYIEIFRRDQTGPNQPKDLRLPKTGADLDPNYVDVVRILHLGVHDFRGVANEVTIESDSRKYECAIILAPAFKPTAGDGTFKNRGQFLASKIADTTSKEIREKYRVYIADELGEGYWDIKKKEWIEGQPFDFYNLFYQDVDDDDNRLWVRRYRPGEHTLLSKDKSGEKITAKVHISRDYSGPAPCLFDPFDGDNAGHWQAVTSWELLKDRLGINITASDMTEWKVGKAEKPDKQVEGEVLNGITPLSDPGEKNFNKPFYVRLTTVIEGDHGIDATAKRRKSSPVAFTISKRIDSRDHYNRDSVSASSPYYVADDEGGGVGHHDVKDDTKNALEKAYQLRTAHEFPPIAGSVSMPRLDFSLRIGDRIKSINGRNVNMQVNGAAEAGEAKSYPFVIARTWAMTGDQQTTTYQLTDRRVEPPPIGARRAK